ncbi:MAG: DUF3786 domain-containing protein [Deltaproteobacteria bacterium]|nr:DUF3786 domain-containing protein [Deltaproteobacteria bacterium]
MPRIDDYKAARALAQAALSKRNPKHVADKSRSEFYVDEGQGGLIVPYFGQPRRVAWPEITVTPADGEGEVPLTEQILILHYLERATGEPLSGINIDFRAVPEGSFYWSAFVSRAKKPLLEMFGRDPDFYLKVATAMGGIPVTLGDVSVQFQAFPLVPITHVLWRGDDEFDPDASILFDETISGHLSTEDIAALAGASVYRLMAAARQMRKK